MFEFSKVGSGPRLPKETSRNTSFDMLVGRWILTYFLSLVGFNGQWTGVVLEISLSGPRSLGLVWGFLGGGSLFNFGPLSSIGLQPKWESFGLLHDESMLS